jgi:hypothetical protein
MNSLLHICLEAVADRAGRPGNGSIAEIGRRCGFLDPSHFARQFRRLRGMAESLPEGAQGTGGFGLGDEIGMTLRTVTSLA